jgi:putative transposase
LSREEVEHILVQEWKGAKDRHGWCVGSYVMMPDHVHFFCAPQPASRNLSRFVGSWKEWTGKRMVRELGFRSPVWQPEFFDHLLQSEESYSLKWEYVQQNPVRAGLVASKDQWKFRGSINVCSPRML